MRDASHTLICGLLQPDNVSHHVLPKVNLGIAAACLIAMLGIEAKSLWRLYGCWRAKQIW